MTTATDMLLSWRSQATALPPPQEHSIAGISGGRTSALMAHLVSHDTVLCFQNTGKEHSKTLDYILRLEDSLQRPIIRLEYRAPSRGEPPAKATFEVVPHERLSRRGEPFVDLLECIRTFRAKHKGLGPIAPWARSRICTSYMKIRVEAAYIKSLGWEDATRYIGLRADEPERVRKMVARNYDRDLDERAPLSELGIVKSDVLRFWDRMPFNLDIPEYLGNCTACFLKDESDLAEALLDPETDAAFWVGLEATYNTMRPGRTPFHKIFEEAPYRRRIRTALESGAEPEHEDGLPQRRHDLIVRQERKRLKEGTEAFSCSCEQAHVLGDDALLK